MNSTILTFLAYTFVFGLVLPVLGVFEVNGGYAAVFGVAGSISAVAAGLTTVLARRVLDLGDFFDAALGGKTGPLRLKVFAVVAVSLAVSFVLGALIFHSAIASIWWPGVILAVLAFSGLAAVFGVQSPFRS